MTAYTGEQTLQRVAGAHAQQVPAAPGTETFRSKIPDMMSNAWQSCYLLRHSC